MSLAVELDAPAPVAAARPRPARAHGRVLTLVVLLYVAMLLAAPVGAVVWSAFGQGPRAFLAALLASGGGRALLLSGFLALIAVLVNTVFGVVVAWVLTRDSFRGRGLLNALVDVPMAVSPVVVGLALIALFGPSGWLGGLVRATGVKIVFALPGMALATIFVSLPFVIREVGVVLAEADRDQEEAAHTLGASPLATFFRVTLPNIRWGLVHGVLLTTARCLGEFGAVLVVSGGLAEVTETGTLFVFRSLEDRRDLSAYAMAVALAAISVALIAAIEVLKRRHHTATARRWI